MYDIFTDLGAVVQYLGSSAPTISHRAMNQHLNIRHSAAQTYATPPRAKSKQ
jgi:hypothetical protein